MKDLAGKGKYTKSDTQRSKVHIPFSTLTCLSVRKGSEAKTQRLTGDSREGEPRIIGFRKEAQSSVSLYQVFSPPDSMLPEGKNEVDTSPDSIHSTVLSELGAFPVHAAVPELSALY